MHEKREEYIHKDTYNNKEFNLIGIFAKNCVEWELADLACQLDSITTVTLYATLGENSFKYICDQTNITTIFLSPDLVDTFLKYNSNLELNTIKNIILFDLTVYCTEQHFSKLKEKGFNVYSLKKDFIEKESNVKESELIISNADTVLTICYTSGTTGNPKGAMVIQRNMVSVLEGVIASSAVPVNQYSAHFSFLPLAHIMERMILIGHLSLGARVGFLAGSVRTTLLEDISLVEPTLLVLVPKVLQRVRTGIFETVNKGPYIVKEMFCRALAIKKRNYFKYHTLEHFFLDKVVFSKIRKKFGRNLKAMLCASAPLPEDISLDIKLLLSCPIVEGWGMTELSGSAFCTNLYDPLNLSNGGIIETGKVKLVDIPDLGYTKDRVVNGVKMPSGEICVYGPMTFIGYYKDPEETAKTLDKDGYVHTGDVGCIKEGNGIKIVDRIKEIFKLSQGEYIIPAKLESVYSNCKYVNQIMIYGNSYKNNIIAIIVPNLKKCAEFLGKNNVTVQELKQSKELNNEIKSDLLKLANEAKFNSLEKVNYFILSEEEFSIENQCLNPSMKIVRKKVETYFKKEIDQLYDSIDLN